MKVPKEVLASLMAVTDRNDVLMASELAEHAHNEALAALERIVASAAEHEVQLMATLMALRLMEQSIGHNMDMVRKAVERVRAGR